MSCTVVALPIALAHIITLATVGSISIAADLSMKNRNNIDDKSSIRNLNNNVVDDGSDIEIISTKHFVERDLETAFMDKGILLKTLEEHGVLAIREEDGKIRGEVEGFILTFEKPAEDKPYNLKIMCADNCSPDAKINDISSEYALNVQEETYLSIVENLKNNNMEIEEEVVEDDNTIVLTINVE